jgi:lipid-A-disaccharide synthase
MKYYLIVGEASGDLHASKLMEALLKKDADAEFRFFGGDSMQKVGGTLVRHYKETAYMGFIPVLLHLPSIFRNMRQCKRDIVSWKPDVVILVDYPGFNLSIAKYIHQHTTIPVYYYISPKIWAWKEYRIKNIKRDIAEMFSILPFEVPFYEKYQYPIHYIGNPSVEEVDNYLATHPDTFENFVQDNQLSGKPIIALLAGSRQQEIQSNLPDMIRVASTFPNYDIVLAAAPGIDSNFYDTYTKNENIKIVFGQTYRTLRYAYAALVTSGTATLETALFGVPQVVCYHTSLAKLMSFLRDRFLKVKYVSLVNLILDKELVPELVADKMNIDSAWIELDAMIRDKEYRQDILDGYKEMREKLGNPLASHNAAQQIVECLRNKI